MNIPFIFQVTDIFYTLYECIDTIINWFPFILFNNLPLRLYDQIENKLFILVWYLNYKNDLSKVRKFVLNQKCFMIFL